MSQVKINGVRKGFRPGRENSMYKAQSYEILVCPGEIIDMGMEEGK